MSIVSQRCLSLFPLSPLRLRPPPPLPPYLDINARHHSIVREPARSHNSLTSTLYSVSLRFHLAITFPVSAGGARACFCITSRHVCFHVVFRGLARLIPRGISWPSTFLKTTLHGIPHFCLHVHVHTFLLTHDAC